MIVDKKEIFQRDLRLGEQAEVDVPVADGLRLVLRVDRIDLTQCSSPAIWGDAILRRAYVDLESDASEIHWYQPEVVPGILQTEAYIRALHATAHPRVTDEEVNKQVEVRLERQVILDQPDTTLSFILSESALRRNIGDATIMHKQLVHLAEVAERPNVELQVLPFDAQTFGAAWVGFTILRFGHDAASDVVYLEGYTDADYLDSPDAVQAYTALWNRLQAAAMGQVESRNLIIHLADEKRARS